MNISRAIIAVVLLGMATTSWAADPPKVFAQDNRVAWCIVPFDAKKRSPEERVEMLKRLGFAKYAYDWRAEHLPTFERELTALQKAKIELTAVWFPGGLNADAKVLLAGIEKFKLKTQLWVMITDPAPGKDQAAKVKAAADQIAPIADAADKLGCTVGLYNHGNWGGEPENQIEVIKALGKKNVGMVYNLHHGHDHLERFDKLLPTMMPYLYCLNLNGMVLNGEKLNQKIMVLGTGDHDSSILRSLAKHKYQGPIGILGHTQDDAEERLQDNLEGLNWLLTVHANQTVARPMPRTASVQGMSFKLARREDGRLVAEARPTNAEAKRVLGRNDRKFQDTDIPAIMPVYVAEANQTDRDLALRTGILGDYSRLPDGGLKFVSKHPATAGVTYRAYLDITHAFGADVDYANLRTDLKIPASDRTPKTSIDKVFPTSEKLPENTLRLYLQFSNPMTKGDAYKHIKLFHENGKQVIDPFLELDEELWSADGKRFTLFFDPGRVKRGLKPREEMGPALEENKKYTLVIDEKWNDENGAPLKATFRKSFSVTAPDDAPVDPQKWTISPPLLDGRPALRLAVQFEKPLDVALAKRMLSLVGPNGKRIDAEVTVQDAGDRCMIRTPNDAWSPGEYTLVIDTRLEDPCGNRVGRAFEIDVFNPVTKAIETKTVERKFVVK